jgi:hypothetical protein
MLLEFPYQVPPISSSGAADKAAYIEGWLKEHKATVSTTTALEPNGPSAGSNGLTKLVSQTRDQTWALIGLSELCLRDCFPHLDVGDAFDVLGYPALVPLDGEEEEQEEEQEEEEASDASHALACSARWSGARRCLGRACGSHVRRRGCERERLRVVVASIQWAHQLGSWAGQLGDGTFRFVRVYFVGVYADVSFE